MNPYTLRQVPMIRFVNYFIQGCLIFNRLKGLILFNFKRIKLKFIIRITSNQWEADLCFLLFIISIWKHVFSCKIIPMISTCKRDIKVYKKYWSHVKTSWIFSEIGKKGKIDTSGLRREGLRSCCCCQRKLK
jgi:hypothetical protein